MSKFNVGSYVRIKEFIKDKEYYLFGVVQRNIIYDGEEKVAIQVDMDTRGVSAYFSPDQIDVIIDSGVSQEKSDREFEECLKSLSEGNKEEIKL